MRKDRAGRVSYVGKANNLRSRAGSYFLKAAEVDRRTADLVREIRDIDYLEADSEVDALLLESRLIKDVQPRFNSLLKDDKTFPYLQITTHEDFPRIEFTRSPASKGVKLYGPFPSAGSLRGAIVVLQRIFKFRTCSLDIDVDDPQWRWFRPCLLASIGQCTAPCNLRITKADYRKDINRLKTFLEGGKKRLLKEMHAEMLVASQGLEYEKAGITATLEIVDAEPDPPTEERIRQLFGADAQHVVSCGTFTCVPGPITPDHLVYARAFPFADELSEEAVEKYRAKHGFAPKVVIGENRVFGIGATRNNAELALELAQDGAQVMQLAQAFGGIDYMTDRAREFIENWEVESYRQSVAS